MKRFLILTIILFFVSSTISFAQPPGSKGSRIANPPKSGKIKGGNSSKGKQKSTSTGRSKSSSKSSSQTKSNPADRLTDHTQPNRGTSSNNISQGSLTRNSQSGNRANNKALNNTQLNKTYQKGIDDKDKAALFTDTDRAAKRGVQRCEKIPTSQRPYKTIKSEKEIEYQFLVPKPGGGTTIKIVKRSTMDRSHKITHWEAGEARIDKKKPLELKVRENIYGGAKISNNKSKIYVKDPKGSKSNN